MNDPKALTELTKPHAPDASLPPAPPVRSDGSSDFLQAVQKEKSPQPVPPVMNNDGGVPLTQREVVENIVGAETDEEDGSSEVTQSTPKVTADSFIEKLNNAVNSRAMSLEAKVDFYTGGWSSHLVGKLGWANQSSIEEEKLISDFIDLCKADYESLNEALEPYIAGLSDAQQHVIIRWINELCSDPKLHNMDVLLSLLGYFQQVPVLNKFFLDYLVNTLLQEDSVLNPVFFTWLEKHMGPDRFLGQLEASQEEALVCEERFSDHAIADRLVNERFELLASCFANENFVENWLNAIAVNGEAFDKIIAENPGLFGPGGLVWNALENYFNDHLEYYIDGDYLLSILVYFKDAPEAQKLLIAFINEEFMPALRGKKLSSLDHVIQMRDNQEIDWASIYQAGEAAVQALWLNPTLAVRDYELFLLDMLDKLQLEESSEEDLVGSSSSLARTIDVDGEEARAAESPTSDVLRTTGAEKAKESQVKSSWWSWSKNT